LGARKKKACELFGLSLRTYERWKTASGTIDKRRNAKKRVANKLTKEERQEIIMIANSKKYCDLPPCKIVPLLADEGNYVASESSFYRVLREEEQLTHRQKSKPAKHKRPKECIAKGPNQVWTWDISYLPSTLCGSYYYLYFMVDIFSRKIVGWSIHETESSDYAARLIKQAYYDEKITQKQLILHSDNGSPMKGITMLGMLQHLGVIPSFSRPSVSDDNPYSEALFKTTKYHSSYPSIKRFESIQSARQWCEQFVLWYNTEHLHSALKFITPQQRHSGEAKARLQLRDDVYKKAQKRFPERWSKNTRNWILPEQITLNPSKRKKRFYSDSSTKV